MAEKLIIAPGVRTFSAYAATGGVAILAIAGLNLLTDHVSWKGLHILRDYVTRRNG